MTKEDLKFIAVSLVLLLAYGVLGYNFHEDKWFISILSILGGLKVGELIAVISKQIVNRWRF